MKSEEDEMGKLLDGVLASFKSNKFDTLREVFDKRIKELKVSQAQVEKTLKIEYRTLNGILDGTTKKFDLGNLVKIAKFLNLEVEDLVQKYVSEALSSSKVYDSDIEKKNFIVNNFDLPRLKKDKIIDSIIDYEHIEKRICDFLGFDSIFEYKRNRVSPAFWSVKDVIGNRTQDLWTEWSYQSLKSLNNSYPFDREKLITFFPNIRMHSTNVEKGLYSIIRLLYKIGITVIYQPYQTKLDIRGATFSVNEKPCIVLTNYRKKYPGLWFALLHELHHVLFDWEEILVNTYHISGKDDILIKKEEKANEFAREYLFPEAKLDQILPYIENDNDSFVYKYANQNQIHPSIIYDFYSYRTNIWNRFKNHYPDIELCLNKIDVDPWGKPLKQVERLREEKIFNNL